MSIIKVPWESTTFDDIGCKVGSILREFDMITEPRYYIVNSPVVNYTQQN